MKTFDMIKHYVFRSIFFALLCIPQTYAADTSDYTIAQLLEPCIEGDNDSRWGSVAETECEQYIMGFTDAYVLTGQNKKDNVCLPATNRPDEVRWAFMKWAHRNYKIRDRLAVDGLHQTIKSEFACKE